MRINEMHTQLANLTDQFTLINSMTHPGAISNHFDAMHNLLSGQSAKRVARACPMTSLTSARSSPSISRANGTSSPMRGSSSASGHQSFAPNLGLGGYLGSAYAPVFVGSETNHPAMDNFTPPEIYSPVRPGSA